MIFLSIPAVASGFLALITIRSAAKSRRSPGSVAGRGVGYLAPCAFGGWFLLAVATRSLALYRELGVEDRSHLLGLDLLVAGCFLCCCVAIWRKRWPWVIWAAMAVYTVLVWVHLWHWRFFEDIFALGALRAIGQARFLGESAVDLARAPDFVLLWDLFLGLLAASLIGSWRSRERLKEKEPKREAPRWWRRPGRWRLATVVLAILSSFVLLRLGRASEQKSFARISLLEEKGVLALHLSELLQPIRQAWWRQSSAVAEQEVYGWFAETAQRRSLGASPEAPNQPLNVVLLQVESLQDFVVDLEVGSPPQPVMPNLRRRMKSGFRFLNTYDQSHLGRTSDAEMLVMASLLPVSSTPAAISYDRNQFAGLPRLLGARGYSSFSAVPFDGSFWNRRTIHPAYGFQKSYFDEAFRMEGERVGWGLNDREFLAQATHLVKSQPEPFVALLITLSLHTPYEHFPDPLRSLPEVGAVSPAPVGSAEPLAMVPRHPTQLQNYLEAMRFFDSAFERFMSSLEASGLAQRTVVVLYGDHDAGLLRNPQLRRLLEISKNPSHRLAMDRVPMVFWVPGVVSGTDAENEGTPWGGWVGQEEGLAGLVDVAPTIFGILGIDGSTLPWQGRNLRVGAEEPADAQWRRGPVPVGLAGNWISSDLIYISKGPGPYRGRCYRKPSFRKTQEKEPCVEGALEIERQLSVARDTLRGNLHRRLQ